MAVKTIVHRVNLDTLGGVEPLFYHYLQQHNRAQFEHHVVVGAKKMLPYYREGIAANVKTVKHARYIGGIRIPKLLKSLRDFNCRRILKNKEADLLVLWNCFEDRSLMKAAGQYNYPAVFYDHGSAVAQGESDWNNNFLKNLRGVISCSYASQRYIQLRWGFKGPMRQVSNPLRHDLEGMPKLPKRFPKERPFRIGLVGRLISIKAANLAIHAAAELIKQGYKVELYIAGKGNEERNLKEYAQLLGIAKQVHFKGVILNISQFYEFIDLQVAPSIRESFGLSCFESSCHGCPVVASHVDGLPEVVHHGITGITIKPRLPVSEMGRFGGNANKMPYLVYDPADDAIVPPKFVPPEELAQAIAGLLDNPGKYEAMSRASLEKTACHPSFNDYVKNLESALLELC